MGEAAPGSAGLNIPRNVQEMIGLAFSVGICAGNSVGNTGMFLSLLSSACTGSRPFLLPTPQGTWGVHDFGKEHSWDRWPQLTQGISHPIWCHAQQQTRGNPGGLLLGNCLGISQVTVRNCFHSLQFPFH